MDSKRVRCARVMPSEDVERPLLDQSPISSTLRYAICIYSRVLYKLRVCGR